MKHLNKIVFALLAFIIICLISDLRQARRNTKVETRIDTCIVERVDTILRDRPVLKSVRITDTFKVTVRDTVICLPIEQKMYGDSTYTAWVSGVNPSLDSIAFVERNKTIYRTEKTTIKVPDLSGKLYAGVGADMFENKVIPKVGVAYQKNRFLLGADVGLHDRKIVYGLNVKLKIK